MNTQAKALDLVVPDSGFAFMPQGPSTVSFVSNYTSFYRLQTVHETAFAAIRTLAQVLWGLLTDSSRNNDMGLLG